jgi:hypothetical protein
MKESREWTSYHWFDFSKTARIVSVPAGATVVNVTVVSCQCTAHMKHTEGE